MHRQKPRFSFDHHGAGFLKTGSDERHPQGMTGVANSLFYPFSAGAGFSRPPAPQNEPQTPIFVRRLDLVGPAPAIEIKE
jgi:hypothetical protein